MLYLTFDFGPVYCLFILPCVHDLFCNPKMNFPIFFGPRSETEGTYDFGPVRSSVGAPALKDMAADVRSFFQKICGHLRTPCGHPADKTRGQVSAGTTGMSAVCPSCPQYVRSMSFVSSVCPQCVRRYVRRYVLEWMNFLSPVSPSYVLRMSFVCPQVSFVCPLFVLRLSFVCPSL